MKFRSNLAAFFQRMYPTSHVVPRVTLGPDAAVQILILFLFLPEGFIPSVSSAITLYPTLLYTTILLLLLLYQSTIDFYSSYYLHQQSRASFDFHPPPPLLLSRTAMYSA